MNKDFLIVVFTLILTVVFLCSLPAYNSLDVEDAHIVKEKVKIIKNSGTTKLNKYHLVLNFDSNPSDCNAYAVIKAYNKNNKCIEQRNVSLNNFENDIYLGNSKIKKVKVLIYQNSGNMLYDAFGEDKLVYNETITKIVKDSTVENYSYTVTPAVSYSNDYSSSSSSSDNDYSSSYDSSYSSYDSDNSYGSDFSYNDYDSEPVSGGSYVGSKNSDKFHYSSCGHAERIKESNRIYFSSREEAFGSGYEPCAHCNP